MNILVAGKKGEDFFKSKKHPEEMTIVERLFLPKVPDKDPEWLLALEAPVHELLTTEGSSLHLGQEENWRRVLRGDVASLAMSGRPSEERQTYMI